MAYVEVSEGLYLLKQRTADKGVGHYGIGVGSIDAWKLGADPFHPVVVDLAPPSVRVSRWEPGAWEVLERLPDQNAALERLAAAWRRSRYDLFENNCEHFARYVATGKRESRQLQGALVLAGGMAPRSGRYGPAASPVAPN